MINVLPITFYQFSRGSRFCGRTEEEEKKCHVNRCAQDCALNFWSEWSSCSMTCGTGKKTRSRQVNQVPSTLSRSLQGGAKRESKWVAARKSKSAYCLLIKIFVELEPPSTLYTVWSVNLFQRFCNMFSEHFPGRLAVLQLPCCTSKQVEFSEIILQNLRNKLPPQTVFPDRFHGVATRNGPEN